MYRVISTISYHLPRLLRLGRSVTLLLSLLTASAIFAKAVSSAVNSIRTEMGTYEVVEISFIGPVQHPKDSPARDVLLEVTFTSDTREVPSITLAGYWDGDGKGGTTGNVFRVRFCPPTPGLWTITRTKANLPALEHQHEGDTFIVRPSGRPGFWMPEPLTGNRWYRRSDGSHPYIIGNTHYDFVSGQTDEGANGSTIDNDVVGNAAYFNKLRFSVVNDLYAHPEIRTFFDDQGAGTNNGDHSIRPNPQWFQRVDRAVQSAMSVDLIADLILNGVDSPLGRRALLADANGGDATPWLRYLAARYGSFPNVWFCLTNEYNTKAPTFTPAEIAQLGGIMRRFLAYPTPLSVHGDSGNWNTSLNSRPIWSDHAITQLKNYTLDGQARHLRRNFAFAGSNQPVFNDEAAYEGMGDRVTKSQAITAILGVFAGGGYASTGYKNAKPKGQYFWGNFNADEHTSANNLRWLRQKIDQLPFWRLSPQPDLHPFSGLPSGSVVLAEPGRTYLLFTPKQEFPLGDSITLSVEIGSRWEVTRWDPLTLNSTQLPWTGNEGHRFTLPASDGPLVHVWQRTDPSANPTDAYLGRPLEPELQSESVLIADLRPFGGNDGMSVMEAEHANRRAANGDQFSWSDVRLSGAVGTLAVALPPSGTIAPDNEAASLEWDLVTDGHGPHYLWIRSKADLPHQTPSFYVLINSVRVRSPHGSPVPFIVAKSGDEQGWSWSKLASPLVLSHGHHRLTLLRRSDGMAIDRLLVTDDATFVPHGPGPEESPRSPSN